MPIYSVDGLTLPAGGGTVAEATEMTALSVSAPSVGVDTDESSGFVGDPHVYFKFTAPSSGKIILDATLSYDIATNSRTTSNPAVTMQIWHSNVGANPTAIADLTSVHSQSNGTGDDGLGLVSRGVYTLTATAGQTYVIALWNFGTLGATGFILRISDYGGVTGWIDGTDQQWVARDPWVEETGNNAPDSPHWHDTTTSYTSPFPGFGLGAGFHGSYTLGHAFGGDYPGNELDAHQCAWEHARKGAFGGAYWSEYPDGAGGHSAASWNGTDPYDGGDAVATCLLISGSVDSTSASETKAGVTMDSSPITTGTGGGLQTLAYNTYAVVNRLCVIDLLGLFGPDGGAGNPTDDPFTGGSLEWETTVPALLGLDVAPDETSSAHTGTLAVRWRIGTANADPDDVSPSGWSPWLGADDTSQGFSGGDAPEDFLGRAGVGVDYPAGGGAYAWIPVPDDMLTEAIRIENEAASPGAYSGLRAVGMPEGLESSSPPGTVELTGIDVHASDYRDKQFMGVRVHLRPARHRWRALPILPAAIELGITGTGDPVRRRFLG